MGNGVILEKVDINHIELYCDQNGTYRINYSWGIDLRLTSTIKLLMGALQRCFLELKKPFSLKINTGDFANIDEYGIASYCKTDEQKNILLIPDFLFDCWPTVGIYDYNALIQKMIEESQKNPIINKIYWKGNTETHEIRKKLCKMAKKNKRIEAIDLQFDAEKENASSRETTMPELCKYRYLIDLPGHGYSARVKILLFSGRPLFLVDREWKEFYFEWMEPFVHYIPVMDDLSDLAAQINWADRYPEKALQIATNAQNFAIEHLTREKALSYFSKALAEYLNR